MFLNKDKTPIIVLLIISGLILLILTIYIYKKADSVHESFVGKIHVRNYSNDEEVVITEKNGIMDTIRIFEPRNKQNEIVELITKSLFGDDNQSSQDSEQIILNAQIKKALKKDPEFTDLLKKTELSNKELLKLKESIVLIAKNVEKLDSTVKHVITPAKDIIELVKADTPYERIMRAHNKLTDENNELQNKKQKELLEINELQKQIDTAQATHRANLAELDKLKIQLDETDNKRLSTVKELQTQKDTFKGLSDKYLNTQKQISQIKTVVKTNTSHNIELTDSIKKIQVNIDGLLIEKTSTEEDINRIKEQIKAVENKTPLSNILKNQLSQLEKQKITIDTQYNTMEEELKTQIDIQKKLEANSKALNDKIQSLEEINKEISNELAEDDYKYKMNKSMLNTLKSDIQMYNERMLAKNKAGALLENELKAIDKKCSEIKASNSTDDSLIEKLEAENAKNKLIISELQAVVKQLQIRPKNHPIGNWDFTKDRLTDNNNKFQSEIIGILPFSQVDGLKSALFKGHNYIKIGGSLNTNAFKSITMMINIKSNPGVKPHLWEFTNETIGGNPCKDSLYASLNSSNNLGFSLMNNCKGPEVWSDKGQLTKSTWQHLTFTLNDTLDTMKLYVNGEKAGTVMEPSLLKNKTYNNLFIFQGIENYDKDVAVAWFRIFDYPLTEIEIATDMKNLWSA